MAHVRISSESSAQRSTSPPNPRLAVAIKEVVARHYLADRPVVADQGCGRLRHLRLLRKHFDRIVLVDKEIQLNKVQKVWGFNDVTVREYVSRLRKCSGKIRVVSSEAFQRSKLGLDLIFNICVLDVEIPRVRRRILAAAYRNLKLGGMLVLIVPRNDQSILVRCSRANRLFDGHFFHHHGTTTFYRNFGKTSDLVRLVVRSGFRVGLDLSVYRQACLVCRKRQLPRARGRATENRDVRLWRESQRRQSVGTSSRRA